MICIAGKNDISVEVLEYLYKKNNNRYELGVVCNQTDIGKNTWQRSLRFYAKQKNIKEYMLEELYEIEDLIFLSLEYDRIIKPAMFKTNKLYNVHFSLLPQYKGVYTSAHPILRGEKYVGVTLHKIDAGIDTGDIIAQDRFKLKKTYTSRDLYLKYIRRGIQLTINNIDDIIRGNLVMYPQTGNNASYYSKKTIDYTNLAIDLRQTSEDVIRQIRAFTFREYQMPKVKERCIISGRITKIRSKEKYGMIVYENECGMMLATIDYNVFLYFDRFEELMQACEVGDLQKAALICSVKEHINAINEKGWSPIIMATYNNHVELVKYLISVGADLYIKDNDGANLLMYAKDVYLKYGDPELFLLYQRLGLDVSLTDYYGNDIIDYIKKEKMEDDQRTYLLENLDWSQKSKQNCV